MPLTPVEIEIAYRLTLERTPSTQEVANIASQHNSLASLRQILLNSEEFYRKFKRLRTGFEERQTPILVHMQIPEATPPALHEALAATPQLQPARHVDKAGFDAICALPRPERLQLRYISGDLRVHAGEALDLPWRRLCCLRRPGPRIHAIYREARDGARAAGDKAGAEMSFGTYLEYSLDSEAHRIELDNGQMRRLAGRSGAAGIGQEAQMLRPALHVALSSETVLGLYERPGELLQTLAGQGFAEAPADSDPQDAAEGDAEFHAARDKLTPDQRRILEGYTAWDRYLYDVCAALLFPMTE